jgi:heme exporter protein D
MVVSLLIKLLLSGSMAMLWSMVNSLQIIGTFPLLNLKMPAIVYMLMSNLASISGFEVIPPDDVIELIFVDGFTETDFVTEGWVEMENESKITVQILGSFFLIMMYQAAYMVIYYLLAIFAPVSSKVR